jgi:hypothetical protein
MQRKIQEHTIHFSYISFSVFPYIPLSACLLLNIMTGKPSKPCYYSTCSTVATTLKPEHEFVNISLKVYKFGLDAKLIWTFFVVKYGGWRRDTVFSSLYISTMKKLPSCVFHPSAVQISHKYLKQNKN